MDGMAELKSSLGADDPANARLERLKTLEPDPQLFVELGPVDELRFAPIRREIVDVNLEIDSAQATHGDFAAHRNALMTAWLPRHSLVQRLAGESQTGPCAFGPPYRCHCDAAPNDGHFELFPCRQIHGGNHSAAIIGQIRDRHPDRRPVFPGRMCRKGHRAPFAAAEW